MTINQKGTIVWPLLFIILLSLNIWMVFSENTEYTTQLRPAHEFIVEDLESVIPETGTLAWGNYAKKKEIVTRLNRLRPPAWKKARHLAYLELLEDLQTMELLVRPSNTDTKSLKANVGLIKGVDAASLMKSMDSMREQQAAQRTQMLPKYKQKVDQLKALYAGLK